MQSVESAGEYIKILLAKIEPCYTQAIFIILIIALSIYLVNGLTSFGLALTPDSLAYREAAMNLGLGRGLSLQRFGLTGPINYAPLTAWPPLYPALISVVMMATDLSVDRAAVVIAYVGYSISGLIFFIIAKRAMAPIFAVVATGVLLLHTSTLTIYSYMWSEAVFIGLMLGVFLFSHKAMGCSEQGKDRLAWVFIVASMLLVVFATYTRFLGMIFIALPALSIYMSKSLMRARLLRLVSLLVVYGFSLVPLFLRNYFGSGHLSGIYRTVSKKSFFGSLGDFGSALKYQFVDYGAISTVILTAAILLVVILVILDFAKGRIFAKIDNTSATKIAALALVSSSAYIVILLILRTWKEFDVIDTRLISPIVPLFLILIFTASYRLARRYHGSRLGTVVLLPMLVFSTLSSFKGYATFSESVNSWRTKGSPAFFSHHGVTYSNYNSDRLKRIFGGIKRKFSSNNEAPVFYSDRPRVLGYLVYENVRRLSVGRWNNSEIDQINSVNPGGVIVLMTQSGYYSLYDTYGDQFKKLRIDHDLTDRGLIVVGLPLPKPAVR